MSSIVQLFWPEHRKVHGTYAGTMTVSFAAVEINRECLSIEKGLICFKQAAGWIWKIPQLLEQNMFVGCIETHNNIDIEELSVVCILVLVIVQKVMKALFLKKQFFFCKHTQQLQRYG